MTVQRVEPTRPASDKAPRLDDSLQYLKGVGPQGAEALGKLGLFTVGDLLRHFPRRWEDRTRFVRVADARPGEFVTLRGVVLAATSTRPKPNLTVTRALLDDDGAALSLIWFNQPYLEKTFRALASNRKTVVVYGQVKRAGWNVEMETPEWEELGDDGDSLSANRIVPVYPLTEGLRQGRLRRLIDGAPDNVIRTVTENCRTLKFANHGFEEE